MNRLQADRSHESDALARPVMVAAMVAVLVVPAIPDLETLRWCFTALRASGPASPDLGMLFCLAAGLLIADSFCLALRGRSPLMGRSGRLIALNHRTVRPKSLWPSASSLSPRRRAACRHHSA